MPVLFLNTTLENSTGKQGLLYCTNDVKVKVALSTKRRDYIFSNILKIFAKQGHEATFISVEVVEEVRGDSAEGEEADHGAHQAEGELVVQVAEQHRLQHQHYAA